MHVLDMFNVGITLQLFFSLFHKFFVCSLLLVNPQAVGVIVAE